jgi:hypothetical protein
VNTGGRRRIEIINDAFIRKKMGISPSYLWRLCGGRALWDWLSGKKRLGSPWGRLRRL